MLAAALAGVVLQSGAGSFDATFGSRGIVRTRIATDAVAWSVAIQRDGKIVVGGTAEQGAIEIGALARDSRTDRWIARSDKAARSPRHPAQPLRSPCKATEDPHRGRSGRRQLERDDAPPLHDQRIAGSNLRRARNGDRAHRRGTPTRSLSPSSRITAWSWAGVRMAISSSFAICRRVDRSDVRIWWRCEGVFGGRDAIRSLVLQPNGKIIAVGTVDCGHYCYRMALARFEPDGSLDAHSAPVMVTTHIQAQRHRQCGRAPKGRADRRRGGVRSATRCDRLRARPLPAGRKHGTRASATAAASSRRSTAPMPLRLAQFHAGRQPRRRWQLRLEAERVGKDGEFAVARGFAASWLARPDVRPRGRGQQRSDRAATSYAMDVAVQRNGERSSPLVPRMLTGSTAGFAVVRYRVR